MFPGRSLAAAIGVALLAGCGDSPPDTASLPTGAAHSPNAGSSAPDRPTHRLVVFSRTIGTDPMTDELVVGTSGRVEVRRLRGGGGARFDHYRLTAGELRGLRRGLARLPPRGPVPDMRLGRWYFTVRVGARTPRYFVAGRVPAGDRPLIRRLDRLIDSSARRDRGARNAG
jgi:hypothetical protein